MTPGFFRRLGPTEAEAFRKYARDNFDPEVPPSPAWHPVTLAEWYRLAAEMTLDATDPEPDPIEP